MGEQHLREAIVDAGKRLYEKGLIAASDGNISARLPNDRGFITTPTAVCKGFLTAEALPIVDHEGKKLNGPTAPSSELAMHLLIYALRPDVNAVVHAHPPIGTGFAASGHALTTPLISEVVLTLGCIPLAEYGTPTTEELAEAIRPYAPHYDALLLANHGALTVGSTVEEAYFRMETLEHFARIALVARLLGAEKPLPPEAVEKLFQIRQQAGHQFPTPGLCQTISPGSLKPAAPSESNPSITLTREQLVQLISDSVELLLRVVSANKSLIR